MESKKKNRKRIFLAALFASVIFAMALGMAASLGGVTANDLGADVGVVASCDTDGVTVAFTNAYGATAPAGYKVSSVTVSGIASPACNGQNIGVTLTDSLNASLGTASGTVSGTSATLAVAGSPLAKAVTGVHVVIAAP